MCSMVVQSGLDRLVANIPSYLRKQRIGILCHQASVDRRLNSIVDLLAGKGLKITALFAPEHGFWGTAQDQIPIAADKSQSLPVHSLYGDARTPNSDQLQSIDVLICDLQDVGSRYYTFVWTMALAMQVCAQEGKRFIVLDRPNPIGGNVLEGPVLDMHYASFVGLYPVPVRHGLTIGELALWLNARFELQADLDVVSMKGWKRRMDFEETGLPWVLPSPNMPTVDTAYVYPGGCLIEGTNLSEGRGTTRPFELIGAPYIDGGRLAEALSKEKLPGVGFRACRFQPTFHKFQGQLCGGVQIHMTDRARFKSFLTTLVLIQKVHNLYPNQFAWRNPPYEYELEKWPFDILCGTDAIRLAIETHTPVSQLERSWRAGLQAFAEERKPFLLYN